ncbi:MAG: DUF2490 domain-containing protein [Erythrobacter sp.]
MTQPHKRYAMLLAALIAAWQPSSARANPEDTQLWLVGFVRGNLSDDISLTIDTSQRWRDPLFGADQQTFRVTVEQKVADTVKLGGGISWFQNGTIGEARLHQQFRYAKGGLDVRTRFEQRWFEGADQVELRLRQRVQYTHPVAPGVNALASSEWFGIIQSRRAAGTGGTEQVRSIIGVAFDVSEQLAIQPSYMLQITPRENRPDAISHIPQITLNYRF